MEYLIQLHNIDLLPELERIATVIWCSQLLEGLFAVECSEERLSELQKLGIVEKPRVCQIDI